MELSLVSATTSKAMLIIAGVIMAIGFVFIAVALVRGGSDNGKDEADHAEEGYISPLDQPFNQYD